MTVLRRSAALLCCLVVPLVGAAPTAYAAASSPAGTSVVTSTTVTRAVLPDGRLRYTAAVWAGVRAPRFDPATAASTTTSCPTDGSISVMVCGTMTYYYLRAAGYYWDRVVQNTYRATRLDATIRLVRRSYASHATGPSYGSGRPFWDETYGPATSSTVTSGQTLSWTGMPWRNDYVKIFNTATRIYYICAHFELLWRRGSSTATYRLDPQICAPA